MTKAPPTASARRAPESWRTDAGPADVATLLIPADASRARRFEIDCRFVVAHKVAGARHGLRVDVDGELEWTRDAPTESPGQTDSMDYHFRREVPAGKPLKIVVKTTARGAQRVALTIEAEED
ncbi:MAG: hypothetical protein ABW032_00055 [Burkholderiaceae bacterium]